MFLIIVVYTKSVSNDTCSTIINESTQSKYCDESEKTCNFYDGLAALADSSGTQYFSICIDLPTYDVTVGSNAIIDN